METRVTLQPAYVLHTRPFQNSSLLVDFFTYDYGRVRAIAKGARREKSRYRSFLQLFHPLLISFSGRGEVKTVAGVESGMAAMTLRNERLFSGLYLNELLTRLLQDHEEHTQLYKYYQQALLSLQGTETIEVVLRRFELNLLAELGYGINLQDDIGSHQPIAPDTLYRFTPDIGFEQCEPAATAGADERLYAGRHLIELRQLQWTDAASARAAKRLLRQALAAHLGEKPLASRSLFTARQEAGDG